MRTTTITLAPIQQTSSFSMAPAVLSMMSALALKDKELAQVTQATNKIIAATQALLVQTFNESKASEEQLQKLILQARQHNAELEIAQEQESQALQNEIDEQTTILETHQKEIDGLTAKSELFTGSLRAIKQDVALVIAGIWAYARWGSQDPAYAANHIISHYSNWCKSPNRGLHIANRGYKVLLADHNALEFEKIRQKYPGSI